MIITQSEQAKHKLISLVISLAFLAILILFLIWFIIVTPNPPFPETVPGGGGGIEFNIGTLVEGTGNVDNNGVGQAIKVVESTEATPPPTPPNNAEELVTSEIGEDIDAKKNEVKTNTAPTVVVPVKPREKTAAELVKEKFLKNQGKNGGGDGTSGHAGDEGRPDGKAGSNGHGGTGGMNDDGGNGPGKGIGTGPGNSGIGFSLAGRNVVAPPTLPKNITEEGKVVVEITVDRDGKVIKAEANGRGTNTNSAMLKTIARQAALSTKFNPSQFEEQKGTLTIIFSF